MPIEQKAQEVQGESKEQSRLQTIKMEMATALTGAYRKAHEWGSETLTIGGKMFGENTQGTLFGIEVEKGKIDWKGTIASGTPLWIAAGVGFYVDIAAKDPISGALILGLAYGGIAINVAKSAVKAYLERNNVKEEVKLPTSQ